MADIIKIAIIFIIILFLLRKKLNVGLVLIIASFLVGVLYLVSPFNFLKTFYKSMTSSISLELLIALTFIRMFEMILREKNILQQMMESIKGILKSKRGVIISMPLLIGMLPSVGGAYFSAPMVNEATKGLKLTAEDKAYTNYWYRHPWEFIFPLYPGIILTSVITGIELRAFILLNLSYAITMLATGIFFGMKGVKGKFNVRNKFSKGGLLNFLPLIFLILLVMLLGIKLHYALIIMVASFFLLYRYDISSIFKVFRHGFSLEIITLIIGIMFFKEILENSGSVKNLSLFFSLKGIPSFPILFVLPFISGMLTGVTVGFVGSTFPLIISLSGIDIYSLSFAFASGYIGVLLSPVHVCLILTREYFRADVWSVYKKIIPSVFVIFLIAILQFIALR